MKSRWRVESKLYSKLNIMTPPQKVRPCDLQKLINSFKLNKACGIDGVPNECHRHLPRRPLVYLAHLINHCIRLSHVPTSWKEVKAVALPKPGKDPKIPQNLRPISLLPSTGKLFEKIILQIVQKHIGERNLLDASQFVFLAYHSTTLQCMRLADHVTLNFNNKMSIAAVFLDIEKAFDTTWHTGLLYMLYKLNFSTRMTKLILIHFYCNKISVSVEGKMSTSRCMKAGMPQGSVMSPTL
jgi:hypothetical protein